MNNAKSRALSDEIRVCKELACAGDALIASWEVLIATCEIDMNSRIEKLPFSLANPPAEAGSTSNVTMARAAN